MKKLISILLTLVMVFGMTTTAFAANITISGGASGSTYAAYKLLDATMLNDGSGKYNFTVNEAYADVLEEATGKTTEGEIVKYISELSAEDAKAFAGDVYDLIKDVIDADYTTTNDTFTGVDQGYYLIAETATGNDADTYSLVMLDTAGEEDITVDTKEDEPTVDKQVKEVNDTTGNTAWGEYADHDVYDTVYYQIKGTVSGKYADYKSYYYSFKDTMDDTLTLDEDSIKVYVGGTVNAAGEYQKDGVDVTADFVISTTEHSFTASANLKELDANNDSVVITADTEIFVTYEAELNEGALHGKPGNINNLYLEYENNPYHEGDGDPETPDRPGDPEDPEDPNGPGKTPIVQNIVFTFKANVNKVDENGEALEGAGFTLYKYDAEAGDYVAVGEEITGVTTFSFAGLDAGKYKLEETTIPSGYNQAADIVFVVVAEYDTEVDPVALTGLSVVDEDGEVIDEFTIIADDESELNEDLGIFVTDVENKPGVTLPTTGGMGTTIFYLVGAILMIGSAVVIITRKRMSR